MLSQGLICGLCGSAKNSKSPEKGLELTGSKARGPITETPHSAWHAGFRDHWSCAPNIHREPDKEPLIGRHPLNHLFYVQC